MRSILQPAVLFAPDAKLRRARGLRTARNGPVLLLTFAASGGSVLPHGALNRVAAGPDRFTRSLWFWDLGWGDAEAAELRLALQYAAAKCAFPQGAVRVAVEDGNSISEEAAATLPPRIVGGRPLDFTGERAVWEGKFCTW